MILQKCSKIQKEVQIGDDVDLRSDDNDDILFEIFIRIPDCRSAIRCSSVSHRWHSLISHPRFIPRFVSQHQDRYPPAKNIIFRKCERLEFGGALNLQPICKLSSDESIFARASFLDFLPLPMVIRASCGDLMLLTPGARSSSIFYICNPVTKQFHELAENHLLCGFMKTYVYGYALVRSMLEESECHFKVLLLHHPYREGPSVIQNMTIYCSKLGKWEWKVFNYPRPRTFSFSPSTDVYFCNGFLYWLEYERVAERVVSLDLSRSHCVIIDFPDDFRWVGTGDFRVNVRKQIGTVGGEVRLVQVVIMESNIFYLKVWKLLDNDLSSWVLLHEKCNRRPNEEEGFVELFVHPTDGDKVLVVWGRHVLQYDMTREDTYETVAELEEGMNLETGYAHTNDRLMAFSMVQPPWPTTLPPLS